jgi:uncharacterized protein (DUF983 family)
MADTHNHQASEQFRKRNVIQGFLTMKCPQCRQGNVFEAANPYTLNKISDTNKHCPYCDFRFEREPGFFTGAMYFSYALNVGMIVVFGLTLHHLFEGIDAFYIFVNITCILVLLFPLTFRYSRMLMLYFFGDADYEKFILDRSLE